MTLNLSLYDDAIPLFLLLLYFTELMRAFVTYSCLQIIHVILKDYTSQDYKSSFRRCFCYVKKILFLLIIRLLESIGLIRLPWFQLGWS